MAKYRKKPVVIEAFVYSQAASGWPSWFNNALEYDVVRTFPTHCLINTLEGVMRAEPGDYIIRGVKGEIYPCKPDIFEATYESVSELCESD